MAGASIVIFVLGLMWVLGSVANLARMPELSGTSTSSTSASTSPTSARSATTSAASATLPAVNRRAGVVDSAAMAHFLEIDAQDEALIDVARKTLARCYCDERHTVAAAVLCGSGKTYTGVNVESCGYGPCAEPIAFGAAITAGEKEFLAIVAVGRNGVMSPCGNCRQLLLDYAPEAMVILLVDGVIKKATAHDLLPGAYTNFA
jgi:cytidine deaminase